MVFDPFDELNRDKRPRRKKSEIEGEKRLWNEKIDAAFRTVLEQMDWPDYVQSDLLLLDASAYHHSYYVLRRNINEALNRLNYEKFPNEKSADFRWNFENKNIYVFRRKDARTLGKTELKQYLIW